MVSMLSQQPWALVCLWPMFRRQADESFQASFQSAEDRGAGQAFSRLHDLSPSCHASARPFPSEGKGQGRPFLYHRLSPLVPVLLRQGHTRVCVVR